MSDVSQWNTTAASNNSASPDGAPEGWAPSAVNDWGREVMAAVKRWYEDSDASLTSAGSGNAYTLTTNSTHAALSDMPVTTFRCDRANSGAATLNVDSLGAKAIEIGGAALAANDLLADVVVTVAYNATSDAYDLLSSLSNNDASKLTTGTLPIARIAAGTVTNAKLADMAQTTVKGRQDGGGTGVPEDLTAAQLVTIINTADGTGSGLDADLLDGNEASAFALGATVMTAGTGITGGGDLSTGRTFDLDISGLTTMAGSDLDSTADGFLASDSGVMKFIPKQDFGLRVYPTDSDQTFNLDDANTMQTHTGSVNRNWTVPPNSSVAYDVGTVICMSPRGAGTITLVEGSGVTIETASGNLVSTARYGMITLIKVVSPNTWLASGAI